MWLDSRNVRPSAAASRTTCWKTASISGSRPEVGSSIRNSSTSAASAATSATFCRLPFEYARPFVRVQLEALEKPVATARVQTAAQPAEQVDGLAAGQVRPQSHIARHVGQPPVQVDGVPPRIAAEQAGLARIRTQQPEQNPDRGRLPGAVGSEEAVHLARRTVRSRPSRARFLPNVLTRPLTAIASVMSPPCLAEVGGRREVPVIGEKPGRVELEPGEQDGSTGARNASPAIRRGVARQAGVQGPGRQARRGPRQARAAAGSAGRTVPAETPAEVGSASSTNRSTKGPRASPRQEAPHEIGDSGGVVLDVGHSRRSPGDPSSDRADLSSRMSASTCSSHAARRASLDPKWWMIRPGLTPPRRRSRARRRKPSRRSGRARRRGYGRGQ